MMTSDEDLKIIRRAYARQVTAALEVENPRIEDAFAEVRREEFLKAGALADPPLRKPLCAEPKRGPGLSLHGRSRRHFTRAQYQQRPAVAARLTSSLAPHPRRASMSFMLELALGTIRPLWRTSSRGPDV